MPQSTRPSYPFPSDYTICPVCKLDHHHDVPRLDPAGKAEVLDAHLRHSPVVSYDLLAAVEGSAR